MEGLPRQRGESRPGFYDVLKDDRVKVGGVVLLAGVAVAVVLRGEKGQARPNIFNVLRLGSDAKAVEVPGGINGELQTQIELVDEEGGVMVVHPEEVDPNVAEVLDQAVSAEFDSPARGELQERDHRLARLERIGAKVLGLVEDGRDKVAFTLERIEFARRWPWIGHGSVDEEI